MSRSIYSILLTLMPISVLAQYSQPGDALSNARRLSEAINVAFINGIDNSGINIYIDVLSIGAAVFFLIRSYLEYNAGSISVNDLVFSKFLFILFIFTVLDPVLYFELIEIVRQTAFDIGDVLQQIFTGFYDFYTVVGSTIFILMNVTPVTDSLSIGSIALISIVIMIAAAILWKQVIQAIIAILFFYFFSHISFNFVAIAGLFILPLVFIKELIFVVHGFGKSVVFLFLFTIIWKLMVAISIFLIFTALYSVTFINRLHQGQSVFDFIRNITSQIQTGQGVTLVINGPLDVVVPIAFFAMAIFLISLTFHITQLIMSGFFAFRANFI